ncbi:MAG: tetratricopeptide repeat protein [Ardenticatenaceae bacterium]|nr:tetratricopeptide repeat protein [Anaerolineales bacterium]MCB8977040.1 tetratricopeptide repeat protein [Ardenticatenaceae bacterium]
MIIQRKDPPYPRRGPSCLLVIFIGVGIFLSIYVIQNAEEVRDVIIPTPTPEPTRSATEFALLADIAERDGELAEAADYYAEAVRLDATKPEIYIRYINLLIKLGRGEDALARAEEAAVLAPENDRIWTAVAAAYIANGERLNDAGDPTAANLQFAQAYRSAETAISINPENATAYAYSAAGLVLQFEPELYQDAQERVLYATELEPDNPIGRLYLGIVLTNQGFYTAAREQFQLGLQAEPLPQLYYELGYNFFGDGNVSEAILSFQEAVSIDPNFAPGYDALAHMYLQLGQDTLAEENGLKSIELNPNVARAHGRLGEAYVRLNKFQQAIEEFGKAVELYGEPTDQNARFFYLLADAYLREGTQNCSLAVPYFQQAAAANDFYAEAAQEGLVECRRAALESTP